MSKSWLGTRTCNICNCSVRRVLIDGRLKLRSSWAVMCPRCYRKYGAGYGIGLGQVYVLERETGNFKKVL